VGKVDILLNNTVLSNFGLINRMELLRRAVEGRAGTTEEVVREFQRGVELGYLPSVSLKWLAVLRMDDDERAIFRSLRHRFGAGEASCLAIAQNRGMKLATDDRDARRYAQRLGIPVSGTIGILVDLIRRRFLTVDEANTLLGEMIERGYHSPVDDLSALV